MNNQKIELNIQPTNYAALGAKGKALLFERQREALQFCGSVGRNIPSLRKKFYKIQNKKELNSITDSTIKYCSEIPKEENIKDKGILVDYILGIKQYYDTVKRSNSPTLQFSNENTNKQNQFGGKRKTKKVRKHKRTTRKH